VIGVAAGGVTVGVEGPLAGTVWTGRTGVAAPSGRFAAAGGFGGRPRSGVSDIAEAPSVSVFLRLNIDMAIGT